MRRTIIGGTDCTECLDALVTAAPTLTSAQLDNLRGLFRYSCISTASAKTETRLGARSRRKTSAMTAGQLEAA